MKKTGLLFVLFLVFLSACGVNSGPTLTAVPETMVPTVMIETEMPMVKSTEIAGKTLDQLMEDNYFQPASFKVMEYTEGASSMKIFFNGVEETIVDNVPDKDLYPRAFVGYIDPAIDGMSFVERSIFSERLVKNKEYVLLLDSVWSSEGDSMDFVLIPVDIMPKQINDLKVWEGTSPVLQVWEHPRYNSVVENLSTKEIPTLGLNVWRKSYSDDHIVGGMQLGSQQWGWVHVEEEGNGFWILYLSQSKPDLDRMQQAVKIHEDIIPGRRVAGPAGACENIMQFRSVFKKTVTDEQYSDICGVYAHSIFD